MTQQKRTQVILAITLPLVVQGCSSEAFIPCVASVSEDSLVVRDSSGVEIVTSSCTLAHQPLGWFVDSVPALELGKDDSPGHQFQNIRGVTSLPDGGVAVLDGGSLHLRYFDATGRLRLQRGGEGAGPGEFRATFFVRDASSDAMTVYDSRLRRFTTYDDDGASPRLLPAPAGQGIPNGMIGSGYLFAQDVLDGRVRNPGLYEQEVAYYWRAASDWQKTPLQSYQVQKGFTVLVGGVPHNRNIPFAVHPTSTIGRRGALITSGAAFEVLQYDSSGSLSRVIRVDRRRRPVRRGDFRQYKEARIAAGLGSERSWEPFADIPIPDSMRAFSSVLEDSEGWVWAEVYDVDTRRPSQWLVFDSYGKARGLMELPTGLVVREIGNDYVLGTLTDSQGIQYVRRYRLQRGDEI